MKVWPIIEKRFLNSEIKNSYASLSDEMKNIVGLQQNFKVLQNKKKVMFSNVVIISWVDSLIAKIFQLVVEILPSKL